MKFYFFPDVDKRLYQYSKKYICAEPNMVVILRREQKNKWNDAPTVRILFWSQYKFKIFLAYYRIMEQNNHIKVVSLSEPKGRHGERLIGLGGLSEQELVETVFFLKEH